MWFDWKTCWKSKSLQFSSASFCVSCRLLGLVCFVKQPWVESFWLPSFNWLPLTVEDRGKFQSSLKLNVCNIWPTTTGYFQASLCKDFELHHATQTDHLCGSREKCKLCTICKVCHSTSTHLPIVLNEYVTKLNSCWNFFFACLIEMWRRIRRLLMSHLGFALSSHWHL